MGRVDVEALDQPPVEGRDAPALRARGLERLDGPAGGVDLVVGRGERPVRRVDLTGMDQRLAVEPEVAALCALRGEPLRVADVVVDAVEHRHARGAGAEDGQAQSGEQRSATGDRLRRQLLEQVVGPSTSTVSREDADPMAAQSSIACGVSTIAQSAVCSGAPAASIAVHQRPHLVRPC